MGCSGPDGHEARLAGSGVLWRVADPPICGLTISPRARKLKRTRPPSGLVAHISTIAPGSAVTGSTFGAAFRKHWACRVVTLYRVCSRAFNQPYLLAIETVRRISAREPKCRLRPNLCNR